MTRSSCSSRRSSTSRRSERGVSAGPDDGLTYAGAGVDIAAGERAVDLIKAHARSTDRPGVMGGIGGFGGLFDLGALALRRPGPGVVDRRRRHEVGRGVDHRPLRHDRHRPRRYGRRHRRPGRGSALLLRLPVDGPARSRDRRDDRGRRRRGVPARRRRAARRRDVRAPAADGPGRVRPRRVRGRRGRARRGAAARRRGRRRARRHREPGAALQRLHAGAARAARTRRARARRARVAGCRRHARRRAAAAERDLLADARARCARRCDVHAFAHITGGGLPGQRQPDPARRRRRADHARRVARAADLRRGAARRGGRRRRRWRRCSTSGVGMVAAVPAADAARAWRWSRRPGSARGSSARSVPARGRVLIDGTYAGLSRTSGPRATCAARTRGSAPAGSASARATTRRSAGCGAPRSR